MQVDLWPLDLESGVQVTCDVGYLCANFGIPMRLYSRVIPDVRDRQTSDVRRHHRLMPPPYGAGHNNMTMMMTTTTTKMLLLLLLWYLDRKVLLTTAVAWLSLHACKCGDYRCCMKRLENWIGIVLPSCLIAKETVTIQPSGRLQEWPDAWRVWVTWQTCPLLTCWAGAMGYMGYIDSNGDPQGNFTLLARRIDRDKAGFGMYPVGSFLLDHNDTKLLVSSLLKSDIFLLWQTISWLVSPVSFRAHVMHVGPTYSILSCTYYLHQWGYAFSCVCLFLC